MSQVKKLDTGGSIFLLVRIGAVFLLFTVLILVSGASPLAAVKAICWGIFGTANGIAEVFVKATPLIFLGLGIAITFRSGFFNLGAEGQFYMGALASTSVVFSFRSSLEAFALLLQHWRPLLQEVSGFSCRH